MFCEFQGPGEVLMYRQEAGLSQGLSESKRRTSLCNVMVVGMLLAWLMVESVTL